MRSTLTISLPPKLRRDVQNAAKRRHMTQSEFVRSAVQDRLWEESLELSRRALVPKARAAGVFTDEDVFKRIS